MEKGHTIKVLDHGFVKFLDNMGSDRDICDAARISYNSEAKTGEDDKKLIRYLFKNKHTSPFEMGKVKLHIKLPIFVMRQYVRHRMQNLNEESARYRQLSDDFYIPEVWRKKADKTNKQGSSGEFDIKQSELFSKKLLEASQEAYAKYQYYISEGASLEMARMVLPVNIYTETIVCWDMNNLIKYLILRYDNHAQWEHFQYAIAMKQIVRELFPWTMECFDKMLENQKQYKLWLEMANDGK